MMKKFVLCAAVAAVMVLGACSSVPKVQRVDAAAQVDLSGYWNDSDVRIVCNALIQDCLNSARVAQAISAKGGTPAVLVGAFKNDSSEHIDTELISKTMETAIFNSGMLDFVAGGGVREELRAERADQQLNASEATAAKLGAETGADFLLTGSVKTVIDKAGNQEVRTYWVNAELTNIATNARMWMGENNEIKKLVTRPKNKL
ncbi:MAG: penicillin-binding protein activator LpoB [Spirochaetaceae bacterium]|jgi:uncharacterized protein (TIGR02722 family)|nr:penicillin-binding protein activator LpoB [Spirochaetaceae bacterium]